MIDQLLPSRLNRDLVVDYFRRNAHSLLVIFGVLLVTAILPYLATLTQLQLATLLLFGLGAVVVFLQWPALGLVVLTITGMVFPSVGPAGLNLSMVLVAFLFVLWLADKIVGNKKIRLVATRSNWPLIAFVVVAFISFGVGQLPWFSFARYAPLSAQVGGLAIVLLCPAAFLLVGNQVRDLKWLKAMVWGFLAASVVPVVVFSAFPDMYSYLRLVFSGDFGAIFWVCVVAISFSQALFNDDLDDRWRGALIGFGLVCLYVGLFRRYEHKASWIPPLVILFTLIALRWPRLGVLLVLIGVPAGAGLSTVVADSETYSLSTRLDAWFILGDMLRANPVFGLGFANYYWNTPLYAIRGWYVEFSSHNNYVDIVAQMGLAGLVFFLWFFGEVGRLGWRLRKRFKDGFARAYVYGSLAILVGMMTAAVLGDWVLPFVYNLGMGTFRSSVLGWLFLGGLVSLKWMASSTLANADEQTDAGRLS